MLSSVFFARDAQVVAQDLLGKVLCHHYQNTWLRAIIIETEAYYINDKASHASLGYTLKRQALFMPPGTIYMYYARGKDSLNVSTAGEGNAVLIKAAYPDLQQSSQALALMQQLNPLPTGGLRAIEKLCAGQTLLCRALNIKLTEWDQQTFDPERFYIAEGNTKINRIIRTRRLGIPSHRDPHHFYRFIAYDFAQFASSNPLTKKQWQLQRDYFIIER